MGVVRRNGAKCRRVLRLRIILLQREYKKMNSLVLNRLKRTLGGLQGKEMVAKRLYRIVLENRMNFWSSQWVLFAFWKWDHSSFVLLQSMH
jgi:hypothetical protein